MQTDIKNSLLNLTDRIKDSCSCKSKPKLTVTIDLSCSGKCSQKSNLEVFDIPLGIIQSITINTNPKVSGPVFFDIATKIRGALSDAQISQLKN